jgi:hypothetical protein
VAGAEAGKFSLAEIPNMVKSGNLIYMPPNLSHTVKVITPASTTVKKFKTAIPVGFRFLFASFKVNTKAITLAAFSLAVIQPALAQDKSAGSTGLVNDWLRQQSADFKPWDMGGSLRGRYENKQGYGIAGIAGSVDFRAQGAKVDDEYFLTRARLHVGYKDTWWHALVEGQSCIVNNDARYAYANSPAVPGTVKRKGYGPESDTIDLHQAYVSLGNLKEFPLMTKVGRQELSYGDERLVGAGNWNNIGRAFDAAKVRWQNDWFSADFFSGRPVVPEDGVFDQANDYDFLSGVYATSLKVPKHILDFYFLARNATRAANSVVPSPQLPQPTARDIYTIGGRLKSSPGELGNWDYSMEGAYQCGNFATNTTSARLTQNTFMFSVQGGYTFTNLWAAPRLGVEYNYSAGDSNPHDGTHGTFDNLFPTNHKYYGYMNFCSLQNIQDLHSFLQVKPTRHLSAALEGHNFWLANSHDYFYTASGTPRTSGGYGIHPNYSTYLGSELDVTAAYTITRCAQLEAGYGHFFTGQYIQQSLANNGGAQDANWFYTQLTLTF